MPPHRSLAAAQLAAAPIAIFAQSSHIYILIYATMLVIPDYVGWTIINVTPK